MLILPGYDQEKNKTVELLSNFFEGETFEGVVNLPFLQALAEGIAENSFKLPCHGIWKEDDYTAYIECVRCVGEGGAGKAMIQAGTALMEADKKGELLFVKVFGQMKLSDLYKAAEWIQQQFADKDILLQAQHSEKWESQYIAVAILVTVNAA